jgi:hypothetical protein
VDVVTDLRLGFVHCQVIAAKRKVDEVQMRLEGIERATPDVGDGREYCPIVLPLTLSTLIITLNGSSIGFSSAGSSIQNVISNSSWPSPSGQIDQVPTSADVE